MSEKSLKDMSSPKNSFCLGSPNVYLRRSTVDPRLLPPQKRLPEGLIASIPKARNLTKRMLPYLPVVKGDVVSGRLLVQGVKGVGASALLKNSNDVIVRVNGTNKGAWNSIFARLDPTTGFLACFKSKQPKKAQSIIQLHGADVKLIGRRCTDPSFLFSWEIIDPYGKSFLFSSPHAGISKLWTEALRFVTLKSCKQEKCVFFKKRRAERGKIDNFFSELRPPTPDADDLRLQRLIQAATEGRLEEVRDLLHRPSDGGGWDSNSRNERVVAPSAMEGASYPSKPSTELISFTSPTRVTEIWEQEVHHVESLVIDNWTVKSILSDVNMAVGQDILRGQLIGVGLTSLDGRSAQIIQAVFRGWYCRIRFLRRRRNGKKKRFVTKIVKRKMVRQLQIYYNKFPQKLIALRRKKRWDEENKNPHEHFSDHLQRLLAFAPNRSEKMAKKIQGTFRGWTARRVFIGVIENVRNNASSIQGWYRTLVKRYWRKLHRNATIIAKYEWRRQARNMLKVLRKETLDFISLILSDTLFPELDYVIKVRTFKGWLRMRIVRIRFRRLKKAAIYIAAWWRCQVQSYIYNRKLYLIIRVQAVARSLIPRKIFRKKFKMYRWAALAIQGWWRAGTLPYDFQRKRKSVTRLAAWYRCQHFRIEYKMLCNAVTIVQSHFRRHQNVDYFKGKKSAVTKIAGAVRRRQKRKEYQRLKRANAVILRCVRVLLAKRSLRRRRRYIYDVILTQSCARRFIARTSYLHARDYIMMVQGWWRDRVFMIAANSYMALLRSASTKIQTVFRRYIALEKANRRTLSSFVAIRDWPNGKTIYQARKTFEDGRDVLLSVHAAATGLVLKGVDLTNGHKKTWDIEIEMAWSSLTLFIALDNNLNRTSWEPEEFLDRLLRSFCPQPTDRKLCTENTKSFAASTTTNGYVCKMSKQLVRMPKSMHTFLHQWYNRKFARYFFVKTVKFGNEAEALKVPDYVPLRNDIQSFDSSIQDTFGTYVRQQDKFLASVYDYVLLQDQYYEKSQKTIVHLISTDSSWSNIDLFMKRLQLKLLQSVKFQSVLAQSTSSGDFALPGPHPGTPNEFSVKTETQSDSVYSKYLQSIDPKLFNAALLKYVNEIHTKEEKQELLSSAGFTAKQYCVWQIHLRFLKDMYNRFVSDEVDSVSNEEDIWINIFNSADTVRLVQTLPNVSKSALVFGRFLKSCQSTDYLEIYMPLFIESINFLSRYWLPLFRRNMGYEQLGPDDAESAGLDAGEAFGFKYSALKKLRNFEKYVVSPEKTPGHTLSVDLGVLGSFAASPGFVYGDCAKHMNSALGCLQTRLTRVFRSSEKQLNDIETSTTQHSTESGRVMLDLPTINERLTMLHKIVLKLQENDALLHAAKLHENKCDETISQSKSQQVEQEKNVCYWKKRKKESKSRLKEAQKKLKVKQSINIGKQERPDTADNFMVRAQKAVVAYRKDEKHMCDSLLKTISNAVLDMKSDINRALETKERLKCIRADHEEWQYVLTTFLEEQQASLQKLIRKDNMCYKQVQLVEAKLPSLQKCQFAHMVVRSLDEVDKAHQNLSELNHDLENLYQTRESLKRVAYCDIVRTGACVYKSTEAYFRWAREEIKVFETERKGMNKAIETMNKTNKYLAENEKKILAEIQKAIIYSEECVREKNNELLEVGNFWWYTYLNDWRHLKMWNLERKKAYYRRFILAKEQALTNYSDEMSSNGSSDGRSDRSNDQNTEDDSNEEESNREGSNEKGSKDGNDDETISVDSEYTTWDILDSGSSSEEDEAEASIDSNEDDHVHEARRFGRYDFNPEDLKDLVSWEAIFMPVSKRNEFLEAKRSEGKQKVIKKAIKNWKDARRKKVHRMVNQRTVVQSWEEIQYTLSTLTIDVQELLSELEFNFPSFFATFEGASVKAAFGQISTLIVHADWNDLDICATDCRRVLGKIDHAVRMLRNTDSEISTVGLSDSPPAESKRTCTYSIGEINIMKISDIGSIILVCIHKLEGIQDLVANGETLTPPDMHDYGENIDHKKIKRHMFQIYRRVFIKHSEKKNDIDQLVGPKICLAIVECGRLAPDHTVLNLLLLRLYGKTVLQFVDFLDLVQRPYENEVTIRKKYAKAIAAQVVGDAYGVVSSKLDVVKGKIDSINPWKIDKQLREKSALLLQSWFRMAVLRKKYKNSRYRHNQYMSVHNAALALQGFFWKACGGDDYTMKKYILENFEKVHDPETVRNFYCRKDTFFSLLNLPQCIDEEFIQSIPVCKATKYSNQHVLNAIKPNELTNDRVKVLKLRVKLRELYNKAKVKGHKTAALMMASRGGNFEVPPLMDERELEYLLSSQNDLAAIRRLVTSFATTTNGLKQAYASFMEIKPEGFDDEDGLLL